MLFVFKDGEGGEVNMNTFEIDETISDLRLSTRIESVKMDVDADSAAIPVGFRREISVYSVYVADPHESVALLPVGNPKARASKQCRKKRFRPLLSVYKAVRPLITRVIPVEFPCCSGEFDFVAVIKC